MATCFWNVMIITMEFVLVKVVINVAVFVLVMVILMVFKFIVFNNYYEKK